jgi:hypothetical protein
MKVDFRVANIGQGLQCRARDGRYGLIMTCGALCSFREGGFVIFRNNASTIQSVARCNLTPVCVFTLFDRYSARLFYETVDSTPGCTCNVPRRNGRPRADTSATAAPRHLTGAITCSAWAQHNGDERSVVVFAWVAPAVPGTSPQTAGRSGIAGALLVIQGGYKKQN